MKSGYEAIIGLEVHTQLLTDSKMFCACRNRYGDKPNTNTCPVCLGLPGALPVVNAKAIQMAITMGLAINGEINERSSFFRKHYFYPDLPKGYQITQGPVAVAKNGYIQINGDAQVRGDSQVIQARIERVHLEEDAGKSNHEIASDKSYVDLNRAGVPLLEIVGAPDLRSGQEAYDYLKALHKLVIFLGICNGNLEEGAFRCDANISVRSLGQPLGTRVEVKNINSFKFVKMAIDYEIDRQIGMIENGNYLQQETRGWDSDKNETKSQRSKEMAMDYCYFPEPNLPSLVITQEEVAIVRSSMPELPEVRAARFISQYGLTNYEAKMLLQTPSFADFFERVALECSSKQAANWMLGEISRTMNNTNIGIQELELNPGHLAELIRLVQDGIINLNVAKETVFPEMLASKELPKNIIEKLNLNQISDCNQIETMVVAAIEANPTQLAKYYDSGKENLKDFFVGQVMKKNKGKVNPLLVKDILEQVLVARKLKH